VADVETGKGRQVWKAEQGRGSVFRAIDSDEQLRWAAGDRLVFPWERDGWTHLYSVSVDGGQAVLLTPGAFEVEDAALLPGGSAVVYSSNQDDIDRRHLWRAEVKGGAPSALTAGDGIEWDPVATSDGQIALLRSDARVPARPAILERGAVRDLAPEAIPSSFPRAGIVVPRQVVFPSADGLPIHGQLFLPAKRRGPRAPAVIFLHGGSRRQMLLGWHSRYYYHNAYALNQHLASRGYVVLSVNYRSGTGYGMEFREALNFGPTGASEFNDVQGAGLYLRGRPDVDPARIGLWGGSYGGYLTALGLARASDLFAAGVDIHGVHDWSTELTYPPHEAEAARVAFESSPMAVVKGWRSPVLLIHGDDDRNVKFSQTTELADALRRQGVEFEQLIFPDEVHEFLLYRNWLEAYGRAVAFFDRQLMRE
jgi:dipeptidyl aminopeptidase/acylaminoacyl peptidase